MKKLSDYDRLGGLRVMGKITRILSPITKDKAARDKAIKIFSGIDKSDFVSSGITVTLGLLELLCAEFPEETLKIIAVVDGKPEEKAFEGGFVDVLDDISEMASDEALINFISRLFTPEPKTQSDTSQIAPNGSMPGKSDSISELEPIANKSKKTD